MVKVFFVSAIGRICISQGADDATFSSRARPFRRLMVSSRVNITKSASIVTLAINRSLTKHSMFLRESPTVHITTISPTNHSVPKRPVVTRSKDGAPRIMKDADITLRASLATRTIVESLWRSITKLMMGRGCARSVGGNWTRGVRVRTVQVVEEVVMEKNAGANPNPVDLPQPPGS
jgi:hypothetical protein